MSITIDNIGTILLLISLMVFMFTLVKKEGKEAVRGMKGSDNMWELLELAAIIWLVIFFFAAVLDIFFEKHASPDFWSAMKWIFIAISGGKVGEHAFKKDSNDDQNLNS